MMHNHSNHIDIKDLASNGTKGTRFENPAHCSGNQNAQMGRNWFPRIPTPLPKRYAI